MLLTSRYTLDKLDAIPRRAMGELADFLGAVRTIGVVFHAPDITILNVVWGPHQWTLPHNHNNRAVIGMYGGREDNIFWRRLPQGEGGRIEAAGARSLCPGEVTILGRDIIHSVTNPLGKLSVALHVYDGDLLVTPDRSHWDAESLTEAPYDPELVSPMFGQDLVAAR